MSCVLQDSRALAKVTHWPGQVAVTLSTILPLLCDLIQQSVGTALPSGWPEEPECQLDFESLAPSGITAGQGLGTQP